MGARRHPSPLRTGQFAFVKQLALYLAKAVGLFALSRWLTRDRLRLLCYHGVWLGGQPHYGDCLYMSGERFERRIKLLGRLGYPVLPLNEALERLRNGTLPDCAVAITIDDAWHSTYARMLPVLRQHGLPATVYVTTYYVAARTPVLNVLIGYMVTRAAALPEPAQLFPDDPQAALQASRANRSQLAEMLSARIDALPHLDARKAELARIASLFAFDLETVIADRRFDLMTEEEIRGAHADGFDIQLHTHTHRMHGFDPAKIAADVERNRRELARILQAPPETFVHFCYPSGAYTEQVFSALQQIGVRSATTTDFGLNGRDSDPMALRRILDCESMSDLDFDARLCGFWTLVQRLRTAGRVTPGNEVVNARM